MWRRGAGARRSGSLQAETATRRPVLRLSTAANTIARLWRLSAAGQASGERPPESTWSANWRIRCAWPSCSSGRRGHLHRFELAVEALLRTGPHHLGLHRVRSVPGERPAAADDPPVANPARVPPFAAPRAAVGVADPAGHLEDRQRRGIARVPGVRRVPALAVDRHRIRPGELAGVVEGVDRHVQHQRVLHRVAEAPEVAAQVEVAVQLGEVAQPPALEEGGHRVRRRQRPARLRHRVDAVRGGRRRDHLAGARHRVAHRLLAEDVAAQAQRLQRHPGVRRRDGDVEDRRRPGAAHGLGEGVEDHRRRQIEALRHRLRRRGVEVHQPHHLDLFGRHGLAHPRAAHAAAAHHHDLQRFHAHV